ncbi:GNAT family N-acetyltransferase [Algoriphagus namhaensis]|uniref:GNAT family N-acetyltransferase n=1 Tax=Algoriphagus namhaensis TaxID=915353 RepID=A0ABV8ASI0_9BACT
MGIEVNKITSKEDFEAAFAIRREVFVDEQGVDANMEYDQFESSASHFLARLDGVPVGAARWRVTSSGVKLERFAVTKENRGKGIGQKLVKAVLEDIDSDPKMSKMKKYLHAQIKAVSLYTNFGFEKVGNIFEECNILHYQMEMNNS